MGQMSLWEKLPGKQKTYRAIRHDVVRKKQRENDVDVHHPDQKVKQLREFMGSIDWKGRSLRILELFAGQGNLTEVYREYGAVSDYDKKYLKTGDSFLVFHRLIAEKRLFEVVDLDPYGFPNRMFPDIFMLIEDGVLIITMPKPYVNILNGITQAHLISYYGQPNPSFETIVERIAVWGLCHWRQVELMGSADYKSVWRMFFRVRRVKATEYTGVRNR